MADTGFIIAGSAVNDSAAGSIAWSDPGNVTADDGTYAVNGVTTNESNWLRSAHNFANLLPIDSIIVGVEVRVQVAGSASDIERVIQVQLHDGTNFIGTAKTPNTTIPDSDTNLTFGASDDLWGAVLNLITIGFCGGDPIQFGFRVDGDGLAATINADATWMKIYYGKDPDQRPGDSLISFQNKIPGQPVIGRA